MDKKLPVFKMVIDPEKENSGVDYIALVDAPAIQVNWFAFNKTEMDIQPESGESKDDFMERCIPFEINAGHDQDQAVAMCSSMYDNKKFRLKFKADTERKIIVSPAMIPDMPIYRRTKEMGEFYVVFDKEQVNIIQEKFMEKSFINNINEMHDPNKKLDGIFMKNSFVSDKSLGINAPEMFSDLPDGTWFISYKFKDESKWNEFVKSGDFRGVSVEGMFDMVPISNDFEAEFEKFLSEITQI